MYFVAQDKLQVLSLPFIFLLSDYTRFLKAKYTTSLGCPLNSVEFITNYIMSLQTKYTKSLQILQQKNCLIQDTHL